MNFISVQLTAQIGYVLNFILIKKLLHQYQIPSHLRYKLALFILSNLFLSPQIKLKTQLISVLKIFKAATYAQCSLEFWLLTCIPGIVTFAYCRLFLSKFFTTFIGFNTKNPHSSQGDTVWCQSCDAVRIRQANIPHRGELFQEKLMFSSERVGVGRIC